MDIITRFPGGKRVDAQVDGFTVATDQPVSAGGAGSAPGPFDLFLASLGACAGLYVLAYCQTRGLPTDEVTVTEHVENDPISKRPHRITLTVRLPAGFTPEHRIGIARAAAACKVKKVLADPPEIEIQTETVASAGVPPAA